MVEVNFYTTNGDIDNSSSTSTYLIVHGFQSSSETDWVITMADNLGSLATDANIILVDWSESANVPNYNDAVHDTLIVGQEVASYLVDIGVNPAQTELIGHSLGAHISGIAGDVYDELTGIPIEAITGLDAAGPEYEPSFSSEGRIESERLDPEDAERVVALHTSRFLGYNPPLADLDVYLNWADRLQPGQSNFIDNHGYAHQLYNELLEGNSFLQRRLLGAAGKFFDLEDLQNDDLIGSIYVNTSVV